MSHIFSVELGIGKIDFSAICTERSYSPAMSQPFQLDKRPVIIRSAKKVLFLHSATADTCCCRGRAVLLLRTVICVVSRHLTEMITCCVAAAKLLTFVLVVSHEHVGQ
jgi:hypothetical protein